MGVIVNPRGTSGSGKTELVRRLLSDYRWGKAGHGEPIGREGRRRPIAYRLRHPLGGRPLAVLGHYEATCGGCDTIRLEDGGMNEAFRLAAAFAADGHDVLLEGLLLSGEHQRSAVLAAAHELHVLRLSTPLDRCIQNVIARRHAGRQSWASITRTAALQQANIEEACRRLQRCANVETHGFDDALLRARELLLHRQQPAGHPQALTPGFRRAVPAIPSSRSSHPRPPGSPGCPRGAG